MSAGRCALLALACLVLAQAAAVAAWHRRPAAATAELVGGGGRDLGDVYVELEPGEFAGTLLLGGMRGLVTDLLWMRAIGAKERGRFYESVALFQLISRVQPRFEQVWEYMAHDLAYNIAFETGREEDKWAWYLAGIEANVRGVERNPRSARLLRHLAWMFHHKGETLMERVVEHDWSGLLGPVLARPVYGVPAVAHGTARRTDDDRALAVDLAAGALARDDAVLVLDRGTLVATGRVAEAAGDGAVRVALDHPLPAGASGDLRAVAALSNFQLAARFYRASLALSEALDLPRYGYVRRMIPLGIESDGNRLRNAGAHRAALRRYLEALEEWQRARAWAEDPANLPEPDAAARARASYERNEGLLRRRSAHLARLLAEREALGERAAAAILERRFDEARALLDGDGWRESLPVAGGVRWYDEVAREG